VPKGLRYISYALPTTWAASAMRSIMSRGWSLFDGDVGIGFLVVIGWCTFFGVVSARGLKRQA
jgi:ABC-type multidrug transport system permease subunit